MLNHITVLLEPFYEQRSVVKTIHCSQAWSRMQNHWQSLLTLVKL